LSHIFFDINDRRRAGGSSVNGGRLYFSNRRSAVSGGGILAVGERRYFGDRRSAAVIVRDYRTRTYAKCNTFFFKEAERGILNFPAAAKRNTFF
jgi:hypothetical protein